MIIIITVPVCFLPLRVISALVSSRLPRVGSLSAPTSGGQLSSRAASRRRPLANGRPHDAHSHTRTGTVRTREEERATRGFHLCRSMLSVVRASSPPSRCWSTSSLRLLLLLLLVVGRHPTTTDRSNRQLFLPCLPLIPHRSIVRPTLLRHASAPRVRLPALPPPVLDAPTSRPARRARDERSTPLLLRCRRDSPT